MTKTEVNYPEPSKEVWEDNYKAPGEQTLQDTWERQARACAAVEKEEIRQKIYEDFLWLLTDFKGIAGGRITANLGVPGRSATTLMNCFVHAPSDLKYKDPDSIAGIYDMLKAQAQTLKSEGGYGMNFSWIRPAGAYVQGIASRTPGVLKFMEMWDKSSEIITMGSEKTVGERRADEKKKIRKGAQMGILCDWHPEVEDFIDAKLVEGRLSKFNLSVGITPGFMQAVQNDDVWQLKFPDTTHPQYKEEWNGILEAWENKGYPVVVYKTLRAKDLWEKIMRSTYSRNDPGVLFLDTSNKLNPLNYAEYIQTTNPCFHGDERFLTDKGYVKFIDSANRNIPEIVLADNRVFYENDGGPESPEKWKINIDKSGVSSYYASQAFLTKENAELLLLTFSNGQTLRCTPDHHIATTEGMIEAKDLNKAHNILFALPELNESASVRNTKSYDSKEFNESFLNIARTKTTLLRLKNILSDSTLSNHAIIYRSSNKSLLKDINLALHANGIFSVIYDNHIEIDPVAFNKLIGFDDERDNVSFEFPFSQPKYLRLESSVKIDSAPVYCIKQDVTRSIIVNGITTRRCGEIAMSTGVCLLFSLNLVKYVKQENNKYSFDFETFKKAVSIAIRFADNINDISNTPLSEYSKSMQEKRRIGVGVLGLGSLHFMLGIRFGSKESLELIDQIFKTKAETELFTSASLGAEKGSFTLFNKHSYFNTHWWKTLPISELVKDEIETIGEMRNSHHSANAPTGNMSIYAECVSGGIEPVFAKEYYRWMIVPEAERARLRSEGFTFPDIFKGEWFETEYMKESKAGTDLVLLGTFKDVEYQVDKNRGLTKKIAVRDYGWQFVLEDKRAIDESIYATANELSVEDHVNTLKVIAKYVNMNSSKTVNLPNDYPYESFKNLYLDAYLAGIKGITSYRAGTMTAVLENKDDVKTVELNDDGRYAPKRPQKLESETHKIRIDFGDGEPRNAYITVSFFGNTRKPYEMFIMAPYQGLGEKDLQILELSARNTSLMLRHGIPIKFICEQLDRTAGQYIFSIPTNISKVLKQYDQVEENSADEAGLGKCPSCGKRSYMLVSSCGICKECNYSGCS